MRVLARIKELDDPQRPTPYALHAMITREVEEAVAEEREACARAMCEGCAEGWPAEDVDGDLLHLLPEERRRPREHGKGSHMACEAAAIRARRR